MEDKIYKIPKQIRFEKGLKKVLSQNNASDLQSKYKISPSEFDLVVSRKIFATYKMAKMIENELGLKIKDPKYSVIKAEKQWDIYCKKVIAKNITLEWKNAEKKLKKYNLSLNYRTDENNNFIECTGFLDDDIATHQRIKEKIKQYMTNDSKVEIVKPNDNAFLRYVTKLKRYKHQNLNLFYIPNTKISNQQERLLYEIKTFFTSLKYYKKIR